MSAPGSAHVCGECGESRAFGGCVCRGGGIVAGDRGRALEADLTLEAMANPSAESDRWLTLREAAEVSAALRPEVEGTMSPLFRRMLTIEDRVLRASIAGTVEARRQYLRETSDEALRLSTAALKAAEQ